MCTKNEQLLAQSVVSVIEVLLKSENLSGGGMYALEELKTNLEQGILSEEVSEGGKKGDERYYYSGCQYIDMPEEKRDDICEFTVTYKGEIILDMFWDRSLTWIMQPNEDKTMFTPATPKKMPGQSFVRSFLKKLADEEREKPGSFAAKYYKTMPKVFTRTAV
jgi:hypothetical protein